MKKDLEPLKLRGERVWRTYTGGREIGRLNGEPESADTHFPEEWMYSITRAINSGREDIVEGVCRLAKEPHTALKDLIEAQPEEMLGKAHAAKWGAAPGVLIKLIDSEERLTIQVHPDKETAMRLFGSRFGKTECWHILGTREDAKEPPCIYLGFKKGITRELWIDCFNRQDYDAMLEHLNRIEVRPGETYLVEGSVPHAIGAGCLILEIQEPTDYTIRVEKVTPSGFRIDDRMCHQGLGFDRMFDCFRYEESPHRCAQGKGEENCIKARNQDRTDGKEQELVGYDDTSCFKIRRLEIEASCELEAEAVFYCLYILDGCGKLKTKTNHYQLKKHDQFFIPPHSGKTCLVNESNLPIVLLKLYGPQ